MYYPLVVTVNWYPSPKGTQYEPRVIYTRASLVDTKEEAFKLGLEALRGYKDLRTEMSYSGDYMIVHGRHICYDLIFHILALPVEIDKKQ